MDNMLEHPWIELQLLIKEIWLPQKAFASILWKKISEVNELLKWKRNITIQRDYLLHQTLWTPVKYWILKQIDYDYSLLDIQESNNHDVILSDSEESIATDSSFWTKYTPLGGVKILGDNEQNPQDFYSVNGASSFHSSEWQKENKDNKDLKNRAQIFKNF